MRSVNEFIPVVKVNAPIENERVKKKKKTLYNENVINENEKFRINRTKNILSFFIVN